MKRVILIAAVLSVGMSLAGWRGRFDEQFAQMFGATGPTTQYVTNGLVIHYPFSGDANNAAGASYNGTIIGATEADGYIGTALLWTADYTQVLTGYTPNLSNLTVSAWIRSDAAALGNRAIVSAGSQAQFFDYGLRLRISSAPFDFYLTPENGFSTNSWTAVGYSYSGAAKAVRIFINGKYVGSSTATGAAISSGIVVGMTQAHFQSFRGTIDEVRVYSRALSDEEMAQNYNADVERSD